MNSRSLDQLHQFAAFIEFLSNPAEHKKLLAEMQKATIEYNKVAEQVREAKEFQAWRNETFDKLKAKEQSLADTLLDIQATDKKNKDFIAAQEAKLAEREAKLSENEKKAAELLATLKTVVQEQEQLTKDKENFYARQEKFRKEQADFENRVAAIDAIMKGSQ